MIKDVYYDVRSLRGLDTDRNHFRIRAKCREIISKQKNNRPGQIKRWNTAAFTGRKNN